MKRKFQPFLLLFSAIVLLSSCLSDNTDTVSYYDTAVTAFSVGTLKQNVVTAAGNDSVIKTDCSKYKFYIDQTTHEIYNPDSLPYGIDASKTLTTITSKNSGTIVVKSLTSDTLTYYSSSDSLDFSSPRELRVYNSAGTGYVAYNVKVNVHKEKADAFIWNRYNDNAQLAALSGMKAVCNNNNIYVFGKNNSSLKIYSTAMNDGNHWSEITPLTVLDANAYDNVIVNNGYLYILSNGSLLKSSDAVTWTTVVPGTSLVHLLGCSSKYMYAMGNNTIEVSKDNGVTWNEDEIDEDASKLPNFNISFVSRMDSDIDNADRLLIVGNRFVNTDTTAVVWGKLMEYSEGAETDSWMYYDQVEDIINKAPLHAKLVALYYNSAVEAFDGSSFYKSPDGGLTWPVDDTIIIPKDFSGDTKNFTMVKDNDSFLWIIYGSSGQVWKGRYNKLGWTIPQTSFR